MLFKFDTLKKIKAGEVTIAFRKWVRPTVKKDGTLHTAVGLLRIKSIEPVTLENISQSDVEKAGYKERQILEKLLGKRKGSP
jgi:hypothetical protein